MLANITATETLKVRAQKDIIQKENTSIVAEGITSLDSRTGDISLTGENNFKDTVEASGKNIAITDSDALKLGTIKASGGFTVKANGDVTQVLGTTMSSQGKVSVDAGRGGVVLNNKGNSYKEAEFKGSGNVITAKEVNNQITAVVNNASIQNTDISTQNNIQSDVPIVTLSSQGVAGGSKVDLGATSISFSSVPKDEEVTKVVTMSELIAMKTDSNNQDTQGTLGDDAKGIAAKASDIRVPLSDTSIITLRGGGVKLPDGVDQQFYIVDKD